MTWLFRRLALARLRFREAILAESVEHGKGLMEDHARRLANAEQELAQVRRRIFQHTDASDVIRGISA